MTHRDDADYSKKHGAGAKPNPEVAKAVTATADDGRIACAQVFTIASEQGVSPTEAGKTVDLLKIRLTKCQLGLFGYGQGPDKKVVEPKAPGNQQLEEAIRAALTDKKLACRDAWSIARRFKVPKMTVSNACEALEIKIKPCQLGAF